VFSSKYKLPFEEQERMDNFTMESMKKLHSLYFPVNWREAATGIERLLLLSKAGKIDKEFLKSKRALSHSCIDLENFRFEA